MKLVAVTLFTAGLLLAVRVMFFGVRRQLSNAALHHRRWPLALAAFLAVSGAMLYTRSDSPLTVQWLGTIVVSALAAGAAAWILVQKSASIPSSDPEDDPRFRFQGHVARVIRAITGQNDEASGRIAFDFDGKRYEFGARWSPEADLADGTLASVDSEVVIEYVDGDVAYVEPWTVVERRL